MKIQHSQEDYLEAILVLSLSGQPVRSVDIAEHLDYSKPSVSRAVAQLIQKGLVTMGDDKILTLTDTGRAQASSIYEKHLFFKRMLLQAGVEEDAASEDACKIEHAISDESFSKVKQAYTKNHGNK